MTKAATIEQLSICGRRSEEKIISFDLLLLALDDSH